jgi:hypothetical protein
VKFWSIFIIVLSPFGLLAQAPSKAYKLGVDGIQAIESGETSAGIKLLK